MFSISNPERVRENAEIMGKLSTKGGNAVEISTPSNMLSEKEGWITVANRGIFRDPKFFYKKSWLREIASYKESFVKASDSLLHSIHPNTPIDEAIYDLIKDRVDDTCASFDFAAAIADGDDYRAAACTCRKYGRPNHEQLTTASLLARRIYSLGDYEPFFGEQEASALQALKFDANGIKAQFERVLEYYGITGWNVIVDPNASAIDVRDKNSSGIPLVVIPVDRKVNGLKLVELIGHELECHLRDSENSRQLFIELLGADSPLIPLVPLLAKPDDEKLYEGHAKLSDVSILGNKSLPKPYYTIAQDLAVHGQSFAQVAYAIYELYLDNGASEMSAIRGAWLATYRTFRGCNDLANPQSYAFGKDYGYLAGFCIAKDLPNSDWLNFASLTLSDLGRLQSAGVTFSNPKYPYLDAVSYIANDLLYPSE